MSYNNRSPDILEYIANLNRVPSEADSQSSSVDQYNLDNSLAMFSNTQYFDFDLGHDTDLQQTGFRAATDPNGAIHDFSFTKFRTFPEIFDPQDTSANDGVESSNNTTVDHYNSATSPVGCTDSFSIPIKTPSVTSPTSCAELNELSRHSAEEDKRRRNTAASARFRIKKKQREQALERSAKEMSDKVAKLENHIKMLETENKWLKDLITDKNDHRMRDAQIDLERSWKHLKQEKIPDQRSDGVGTEVIG